MELFANEFTDQEKYLIAKYEHTKKIAELEKSKRAVELQMKEQNEANAHKVAQLEKEADMTNGQLNELKKDFEKQENKSKEMLDKMMQQMNTAREEDRAHWEQEIERYRNSIQAEQEARNNAEKLNAEKLSELKATIHDLNSKMAKQNLALKPQLSEIQSKLDDARSSPINHLVAGALGIRRLLENGCNIM